MKGGKRRNSSSDLQSLATSPPSEPTATVTNGGDLVTDEGRTSQDESEKLVSAEEAFDEEEEMEDRDSEAEQEYDQVEDGGEAVEATKLADGYYEIEAVRRKRIRKGQVQYLIKWRGWPETANTWEPFKNLLQCSDYIESFEESLKAGKNKWTRKRKRKSSINHVLPKKKQREQWQRPPAFATYCLPQHAASIADEHTRFSTLNGLTVTSENGEVNVNGVNSTEISKQLNDSYVRMVSPKEKDQNELDLNPCELKRETTINMEDIDGVNMTSGESQPAEVVTLANALQKTDGIDPVQPGRCTGAKKRKSGSVKRFKKDPVEDLQIGEAPFATPDPISVQNPDFPVNNIICKNKYENPYSSCTITEIIKPISYRASVSNSVHDVLVVFEAMRSDGTKVTVDNKFLKANDHLLLIDYYERNLQYNPL